MGARLIRVVEVGQYFCDQGHWWFQTISFSGLSRIHSSSRWSSFRSKMMDAKKHENWAYIRSHNFNTANMGLKSQFGLWVKIILNLGSEYLMEQTSTWSIQITTIQKSLQIHMKIKRHNRVKKSLRPDPKQKQNHKRENLSMCQTSYRWTRENGLTLNHQNKILPRTKSRKKWSVFFDTTKQYSGKTMEQFNSEELNFIFEINSHKYSTVLMSVGNLVWQQEEVQKEDISIVLIIQEQFFTSVLFRDTPDVISLIWSRFTVQCDNSAWIIPSHLPHWMCVQSSLYYQQWIDTWRSGFEQKTNSILLAHWSKR